MIGELAIRIGAEAVVAPVLTSFVASTLQKNRQRRRCSYLHTLLLRAPESFVDDVARMGVEEGCWTDSFVKGFLDARKMKLKKYGTKSKAKELVEKVAEKSVSSVSPEAKKVIQFQKLLVK